MAKRRRVKKIKIKKWLKSLFVEKKRRRIKSPPRKTQRKQRVIIRTKRGVLARAEENPIISPRPENSWEAWQTFNPGVILLNDKVHFLYRAIGNDGISRFGYAVSNDGFRIAQRLRDPVYEHRVTKFFSYYSFASGGSFGGAEDPRPVRVSNEDRIYMTYTACDEGLRVALTSIGLADFLKKRWKWRSPRLISPPGEVHKNWVIFPEKIGGKYAILTSISPEVLVSYRDSLEFQEGEYLSSHYNGECRRNCWDTCQRGAGAPPIKTKDGWLLFYHAIDERDPGKYKVGAMLLDLDDPSKILRRSKFPVLEPEEVYEHNGYKGGVIYASGAVVKDGLLLVYYGAADSYVGVAYVDFEKFLEGLMSGIKPRLERRVLG